MRTLDEVIEILERQIDKTRIKILDKDLLDSVPDALHYLKAFCDAKDTLEREKDRYAEAVKNCERAENIYKQKQKAAEDALWICKEDKDDLTALRAYWAEQQANNPLDWETLKQMEGKPVWVEYEGYTTDWEVIEYVGINKWTNHEVVETHMSLLCKEEQGKTWNAYRKERG